MTEIEQAAVPEEGEKKMNEMKKVVIILRKGHAEIWMTKKDVKAGQLVAIDTTGINTALAISDSFNVHEKTLVPLVVELMGAAALLCIKGTFSMEKNEDEEEERRRGTLTRVET